MRAHVAVYERKGKLIFRASSGPPGAAWIEVGECAVLSVDAVPEEVGQTARAYLAISGTLDPRLHRGHEALFKAAGVSSWAIFGKGSKNVSVTAEGDQITVTPTDRRGRTYWPANAEALRIPTGSEAKLLGETVLRALANST